MSEIINKIKFSHNYYKLPNHPEQRDFTLIQVMEVNLKDLSKEMLDYDTAYFDEENGYQHYKLKPGKYLMLFFQYQNFSGDSLLLTTLRPAWPPQKIKYYKSQVGKIFKLEMKNE
jgi:hypothetical protein